MKKFASILLQDLFLNLTYSKLKNYAPYDAYYNELKENMLIMLKRSLPYTLIEKSLSEYGYEVPDIRKAFYELTLVKPEKILFMKYNDFNSIPDFVPKYNYAWGYCKKDKNKAYYILSDELTGGFVLYESSYDNYEGTPIKYDLSLYNLKKELIKKVDRIRTYDAPAWEDALLYRGECKYIDGEYEKFIEEINERNYNLKEAKKILENLVKKGHLTYDEALLAFKRISEEKEDEKDVEEEIKKEKEKDIESKNEKEIQQKDIENYLKSQTPTDYFKENIPNRGEINIANQIKTVLAYINNKAADFSNYDVKIFKINYEYRNIPSPVIQYSTETGILEGNYKAVISIILEMNKKGSQEKKYGLMLFFVAPDNSLSTSDSFKGEDDIIYGFTENGIAKYFG